MKMNSNIKILTNPWAYLLLGILPLIPIWSLFIDKYISVGLFLILSLVYMLFYRPVLNILRLRALGIKKEYTIWQIIFVIGFKHYWKLNIRSLK